MGLFDIFKKKASRHNCTYETKEINIQTSSTKTENHPCVNAKPSFSNKRCCSHCGVDLNLLKPEDVILNEADNKEYCDICAEKLTSKKEYVISVGTRIILRSEPICTPDMGGYPGYINRQLIVRENDYLIITMTRDFNGDETYREEIFEKGFFTKFPIAAAELGFYNVRDDNEVIKLLEYDKKISGQSL